VSSPGAEVNGKRNAVGNVVPRVRASQLLRARGIWITSLASASVLIFLITLFYMESLVNPEGHLSGLPVALVNEDQGATVLGRHVDIGNQVVSGLQDSSAVSSRLSLHIVTIAQAENQMNSDDVYATVVIPPHFTSSLLSAYDLSPSSGSTVGHPIVRLLTNPRSGSIGVQLASGVAGAALRATSLHLGRQLSAEASNLKRVPGTNINTASPLHVTTSQFNPLPPNSALGLSAFYIALLALMCGFLGSLFVNTTVDGALGYGSREIGPKWTQRLPVAITRWQTLLTKWVIAVVAMPFLNGIVLLVAVGILHMNAPSVGELWLFTSFGAVTVAAGTLALLAIMGTFGQMTALILFVYLALASSGGTIPLQALPSALRFVASVEPMRQLVDGVRAILYFGAAGNAGLTHGIVMTGIGLAFWLILGAVVTAWYDHKGLGRATDELLAYIHDSAIAYTSKTQPQDQITQGEA